MAEAEDLNCLAIISAKRWFFGLWMVQAMMVCGYHQEPWNVQGHMTIDSFSTVMEPEVKVASLQP